MAPKFGNYLFRNLKSGAGSPEKASNDPAGAVSVEDQDIVLQPADFTSEIGGALNWGSQESREIRVKLRQTDGLMDGRVTISAKMLRELYPGLVPEQLKEETSFPVSLRTVVLQLQNVMRSPNDASPLAGPPDFDTPIAQVAREDEGFFKLEENASSSTSGSNPPAASSAGDFASILPLIREKEQVRDNPPAAPPIQVVAPLPAEESAFVRGVPGVRGDPGVVGVKKDPFADLPKPKLPPPKPPVAASPPPVQEIPKLPEPDKRPPKPQRRRGLELLQELFLTDDFLDAGQVAQLLRGFPKVRAALIMLDDGTVLGGDLPENYRVSAALPAPALMRAVREFGTAVSSAEVSAFTLLADLPISIFLEGRVCMMVVHEGRGLLPGMRERFSQITKALDALYDPGDKDD
ncbi:MAG: hypothetical protein JOZ31_22925 [Verrucomicrobia bacterium]|nr:hypothetical protein [Verrucomicrobiota bacterium]MBV8482574.1 hypothetical protein [Verrucomicrobiota bacterium]